MPAFALRAKPGINVEATPTLNESAWSTSSLIRFFQGYLQKIGGWVRLISTRIFGTARAMLAWEDANSNLYLAIGSEQAFEVYTNGVLYNVTPVVQTDTITPDFSTVMNSKTVTVTDTGNPGAATDLIIIANSISVGGLILQGTYEIQTVVDPNNYTITAASAASSTVNNGGAAALFTTTMSSQTVQVTLNDNGLTAGTIFTVYVPTTVGGITLSGIYQVQSIIDPDNFTITASSSASSSTTGYENGGNVSIDYLLPSGPASSIHQGGLYGEGEYGLGTYGIGQSETFVAVRLWSFGYWGTDINASFTNGGFYTWISENGLLNNMASQIMTAPLNINSGIFTAMPEQQAVACGASDGGSSDTDQLLVRWSDVADNTDWTASATNQAGSFRIGRGSHITGGIQGPQSALIWTDVGMWLMQYIGFPLVFGFTEIGQGCGLIGQNAKGVLAGKVYWMSFNSFFVYDGNSVQVLPCPVWDKVFQNLNVLQQLKVIGCPNSFFNEISWCYPSATGNGENDSRVTYCALDGTWTFDPPNALIRTAWLDQSSLLNPLGIDGNGLIQQHENGNDADGSAITCYAQSGFYKISEGNDYTFIERLLADAILENDIPNTTSTLQFTMYFQNYQYGPVTTIGPLNYSQTVTYLIVHGRGRFVSVKVGSSDLGSFWRLGEPIYVGSPAGRR